MKNFKVTTQLRFALVVLGLAFTACTTNESVDSEVQELNYSEIELSAEIDGATAALDDVMIEVYELDEQDTAFNRGTASKSPPPHRLPECVTVTIVAERGFREVTIDFGTEGCMVRNHLLRGKVIMTYQRNPEAQEVVINYGLEDFYFDDKRIQGSRTVLKQLSNDNGNPQFTHTLDLMVFWPDGGQASREGVKIREWVEGYGSGIFSDNVFEVTGNWSSNFVNGNTHRYEVVIPLRREVICRYFVSGSIDIERTNFSGIFDYGDGECDNIAIFTHDDGTVKEIILN